MIFIVRRMNIKDAFNMASDYTPIYLLVVVCGLLGSGLCSRQPVSRIILEKPAVLKVSLSRLERSGLEVLSFYRIKLTLGKW